MRIRSGPERFPCTPCGPCARCCPRLGTRIERLRPSLLGAIAGALHPGLRRLVDPEDVVQEAFVEVLRRAPRYLENPSMPFKAWVRWITWDKKHQVHRHHLAAGKRDLRRIVPLGGGDPAPFAADGGAWREDTARRLGLGVSASSHRFNRALRRLRLVIRTAG